ncbi:MAG: ATP-binding protein [Gammaproteobacteria bacterium]|nr:ATP-binding protein [Gammaproteobacteria bacterium]
MIHLVCGPIGAGKTAFAQQLAEQQNAIRFSEDEWLARLFVADAPEGLLDEPIDIVMAWASERYGRCRWQIWKVCEQLLKTNVSVVLDGASANIEQRNFIRTKAQDAGVSFKLYYVHAAREARWSRVVERNITKGQTYSLDVTPDMFEMTEKYFQAPVGKELAESIVIDTSDSQPIKKTEAST